MVTTRILPMGERALLAEVDGLAEVLALHAALAASRPEGVVDLVPAARTVLVTLDPARLTLAAARAWIRGAAAGGGVDRPAAGRTVDLPIRYDGPDLADTAHLLGIDVDALVRHHSAARWRVAFTGFAPGFGYLVSEDWPFEVPRLDAPRTRVPAGSVGLAAGFTGAYPRETPGGWRLIGTAVAALFDPDADSPALLAPGAVVRFEAVAGRSVSAAAGGPVEPVPERDAPAGAPGRPAAFATGSVLRVVEPGLLATVQDLGRPGAAALGVARSGALDRRALRTANRLVGNREDAAAIEVTMGGFRAVATADTWVAVTGAWGPLRLGGAEVDPYAAHPWCAGTELSVGWFAHGARAVVAVRGGIRARPVLGSASTDLLAGLGPAPLAAGDVLDLGRHVAGDVPAAQIAPWSGPVDDEIEVELGPGPRADWFAASALEGLFDSVWTVSSRADRVGIRLEGPELERTRTGELPSEGMVPGALQVPPSGRPTVLMADGPVTGGYPVIAVATEAAQSALAQARPGTRVRFRHARSAI
ncbi:5-oxoprolinase subunit B/C family protein [Microbacterium aureliae]